MNIQSVQDLIDFFLNCVLNVWNCIKAANAILFAIMVVLCLYPVLRRITRALRGGK